MKSTIAVVIAIGLSALAACTTALTPEGDARALQQPSPPPDLEALPGDLDTAPSASALSEQQAEADTGTDTGTERADVEILPGLRGASETVDPVTGEKQLPFEQSLERRQKRIYLGLEGEEETDQPVNNVLDIEF